MFCDYVFLFDVIVIECFWKVDVILFGKINFDEFVMGSLIEYLYDGVIWNLWDLKWMFGGFSGGLVVVVVVRFCLVVLGIDMGGLIC